MPRRNQQDQEEQSSAFGIHQNRTSQHYELHQLDQQVLGRVAGGGALGNNPQNGTRVCSPEAHRAERNHPHWTGARTFQNQHGYQVQHPQHRLIYGDQALPTDPEQVQTQSGTDLPPTRPQQSHVPHRTYWSLQTPLFPKGPNSRLLPQSPLQ